jgi:hypothetical protein
MPVSPARLSQFAYPVPQLGTILPYLFQRLQSSVSTLVVPASKLLIRVLCKHKVGSTVLRHIQRSPGALHGLAATLTAS